MIQRIPKVNVMGIVAMCASFWVSALLVHGFEAKSVLNPFHPKVASPPVESGTAKNTIPPGMIRNQPNAPIKFIGLDEKSSSFTLIAKNVSGRPITGYALAYNWGDSKVLASVSRFAYSTDDPTSMDVNESYSWGFDPKNVKDVWVDFVEFSDGTIWGPNTTRTLEKMNAKRIGSRQAATVYRWVLVTKGPQAMLASLSKPVKNTQIEQYDEIWGQEFDSGVEEVCKRLLVDKAYMDDRSCYGFVASSTNKGSSDQLTENFHVTLSSFIDFRRQ